ncbi:MAG TPA: PKD domain-containing protein, partial [candidate division CPR3 bacterium]|nr:PKD domain-containing protein [candidate division CPR3 bacterium]
SDVGIFNDDNVTKLTSLTFAGTGENGSTIRFYRDADLQGTILSVVGGEWSIALVDQGVGVDIPYKAIAEDVAGNVSSYSDILYVTIDIVDPVAPSQCSFPCDGNETTLRTPTLSWDIVSDPSTPVHYQLQLATNAGFSSPLVDQSLIKQGVTRSSFALGNTANILADGSSATTGLFLDYNTTYYWKTRTTDGAGNMSGEDSVPSSDDWSPAWSFRVAPPLYPPVVSTSVASGIGETSAVLNGYLTSDGGEASSVRFNWGTTSAYGNDTGWLNNKSGGTSFSTALSGLEDSTLYHFRAEATNSAGTVQGSDVTFTTLIPNRAPIISSVADTPDPIAAASNLTFNVYWSDPDGDAVTLFVCKSANGVSGGTCQGGASNTWCKDLSATASSPAACFYTTQLSDEGANNYYAYVCDSEFCSSATSGSFFLDVTSPTISSFGVVPIPPEWISNVNTDVTISWTVGDLGGSFLKEVQIWRSGNGGGSWDLVLTVSAPSSSTSWTSSATDAPSSGVYLYGLHAVDNVGNEITESEAGFALVSVQADTRDPDPAITNPGAGTWFKEDFVATFDDSDLGGSGLVDTCEYRFIGLNPSGSDLTSGDLTRQCDLDTKTIAVGSGQVCQFEGQNRCKVQTQAFDNAGNSSDWQSRSFGVDFTNPVITNIQPSVAQVDVATTFTADLTDPIGHVTGCSLFTAPVGGSEWTTDSTVIDPISCENGHACTVSGDHTFGSTGEYQVTFGCTDQAGNTGWGASTAKADTLSVVGAAIPASGTQQTQFDLKATVSGTMEGTINYKFDCMADGTWELEVDGEVASAYTAEDICSYTSEDTYTAKVLVERGTGSAEDTVSIEVLSNAPPSAINLEDNNDTVDYCFAGAPPIILSWDFDDQIGDSQTAYQVQVDTNAGFSPPEIDSDKVDSSSTSYVPVGLSYDTRYWWRVMVWDEADTPSAWAVGSSFTTPVHAYPTTDFSWSPTFPSAEEEVQFTDQTIFASGSSGSSWSWDFGDTGSSTETDPVHIYADIDSYTVQLIVSDDVGSCTSSQELGVSVPLPEWLEISPF